MKWLTWLLGLSLLYTVSSAGVVTGVFMTAYGESSPFEVVEVVTPEPSNSPTTSSPSTFIDPTPPPTAAKTTSTGSPSVSPTLAVSPTPREPATRPHVLILMVDDLGWADIGYHSDMDYLTPTLDSLANEGLKLERMYTTPLCGPSRAAFLTGRMQHSTGYGPGTTWNRGYSVPGSETMIGEVFKGNDYHNIVFGKWGIGGVCDKRFAPLHRGFDNFVGPGSLAYQDFMLEKMKEPYSRTLEMNSRNIKALRWQYAALTEDSTSFADFEGDFNYTPPFEEYRDMHLTDVLGKESVKAVNNYAKLNTAKKIAKPLLMYVSFRAPHTNDNFIPEAPAINAQTPTQIRGTSYRQKYLRMVNAVDQNVADIVQAFKSNGLWQDTITFFISDNGGLNTNKGGANNGVLNGGKGHLWEGGIRVPSFIRGTETDLARVRQGETQAMMHIADVFPTLVEAAGLDMNKVWKCSSCTPHQNNPLDGISQWPVIRESSGDNTESPRKSLVHSVKPEHAFYTISNNGAVSFDLEPLFDQVETLTWNENLYKDDNFNNLVKLGATKPWQQKEIIYDEIQHSGGVVVTVETEIDGDAHLVKLLFRHIKRINPFTGQTSNTGDMFHTSPSSKNLPAAHKAAFPQFAKMTAYLFDLTTDQGEKKNLLASTLSQEYSDALMKCLELVESTTDGAVLDLYLRRGMTPDLTLVEPFTNNENGYKFWDVPLDQQAKAREPYMCRYDEF